MECWLCLAGGNALGAFHVGAWSAIEADGLDVTRIAGASIGAVVAAVIAGNAPAERASALAAFVEAIAQTPITGRKQLVTATLLTGNHSLFAPSLPGVFELLPFVPPDVSLFRRNAMQRLLDRSIDFDRLNAGGIEVSLTALDAETGEIAVFRNTERTLTVDHVMASTALPGLFRPVTIEGRTYFDPGVVENLPLPCLLDRQGSAAILALDLFPLTKPLTQTLNGIANRAQELAFAGQSARIIQGSDLVDRRFQHLILDDPLDDFAGKAFDYSRATLQRRMQLGEDLTGAALQEWSSI